jgi:hypothetical protein
VAQGNTKHGKNFLKFGALRKGQDVVLYKNHECKFIMVRT